jgi:hypothetical protein
MAKKPTFTEQQIVAYLLSGGTVDELSKNSKITSNQILSAIVNNPKLFTSLQGQAQQRAEGLDMFDETANYIAPEDYMEPVNKYSAAYATLNPKAAQLAEDYMAGVFAIGNNPAKTAAHRERMRLAAEQGGMDPVEVRELLDKFEDEQSAWLNEELDVDRQKRNAQFKGYGEQRKALDLQSGDNPVVAAMSELTGGYGRLAGVISPDVTWEKFASNKAVEQLAKSIKTKGKAPKGGFTNVRQADTALDTVKSSKDMDKQTKEFMQGYLNVVKKKVPKGQTPFTTEVKKLLPYLQSNNPFGK